MSTSSPPAIGRTRRFVDAVKVGYVSQVVFTVAGLFLTPFILRRIGQHDYGLWIVGLQITSYLLVLDLGVMALLPRDVAYATRGEAGDAARDVAALVRKTGGIVLGQLPFVALVAGALWLLLPREWERLRAPLGAILLTFVFFFPTRIFPAVLTGLQDQAYVGWVRLAAWVVGTAVSTLLVLDGRGLSSLAAGWVLIQTIPAIVCWWRLRTHFPGVLPTGSGRTTWRDSREYLAKSMHVSVAQIAQTLVGGTDILIITKLLGPAAVVPYALTGKLISLLSNQPQLFVQVALPGLAQLRASADAKRLPEVSTALQSALLIFSGAVACLVLMVNGAFVDWWVGHDQFGGVALTVSLVLVMALRHWNFSVVVMRFAFGDERRISYVTLADGIVTTGAAVVLVHWIGPLGAPLGALAGVGFVSLPSNLSAVAREMSVPVSALLSPVAEWMKRLVPVSVALVALSLVWPPPTFIGLAMASILALAACAAAAWPMVRRSSLAPYAAPLLRIIRWPLLRLRAAAHGD